MIRNTLLAAAILPACLAASAFAGTTTFDGGTNGWGVFGTNDGNGQGDFLETTGGNPGANIHFVQVDTFGVNFHNDSDPALLGDYSRFTSGVKLGVDLKVNHIEFNNDGPSLTGEASPALEVERHLVAELIDNNPDGSNYPYTSVWYDLGAISQAATGTWTHFEVDIANTSAAALPAGWGGYGDEDPNTFEPILPAGRTFASVLASVDEVRFTTYQPGFFYGFTAFDMQYDNAFVVTPEPTTLMLAAAALPMLKRRRR